MTLYTLTSTFNHETYLLRVYTCFIFFDRKYDEYKCQIYICTNNTELRSNVKDSLAGQNFRPPDKICICACMHACTVRVPAWKDECEWWKEKKGMAKTNFQEAYLLTAEKEAYTHAHTNRQTHTVTPTNKHNFQNSLSVSQSAL